MKPGEAFGARLGDVDQALGADETPEQTQTGGVADEVVVLGAGEKLGGAGIALAGGAAE